MTDLDRAVPAPAERRPQPRRRRQFKLPGWTVLIVLMGAIVAFSYFSSRDAVPLGTVEIETWACTEPIEPDQPWQAYVDAGCEAAELDTDVVIMFGSTQVPDGTTSGATTRFERIAIKSIEMALRVDTAEGRQQLLLVNAAGEEPEEMEALSGDRAGQRWTAPFRPDGDTSFRLLHGPVVGG